MSSIIHREGLISPEDRREQSAIVDDRPSKPPTLLLALRSPGARRWRFQVVNQMPDNRHTCHIADRPAVSAFLICISEQLGYVGKPTFVLTVEEKHPNSVSLR